MDERLDAGVIGRYDEIARLERLVDDATRRPVAVVLEGDGGAGKSTLFEETLRIAQGRGFCMLSSRPARPERDLSFSGLRDLLDPVWSQLDSSLPDPQRHALAAALFRREPSGALDPGLVAVAVLSAIRVLSSARPLTIAIDDARWLDAASTQALGFVLRRLQDEPILLLVTRRRDESVRSRLEDQPASAVSDTIAIGPLSLGAIHVLIRRRLGRSVPRPLLRKLFETVHGNPFYALEISKGLGERGPGPSAPFSIPASLSGTLTQRIDALSASAQALLAPVAALSRPTLEALEKVTGRDHLEASVDGAIEAGVLRIEGATIRFTHPLLAAAAYSRLPPLARRQLHGQIARVVEDLEERARHLAQATVAPDAQTAEELSSGAASAAARGAHAAAAELYEEAVRLTPSDDDSAALRRGILAADHHFLSGDIERATLLLRRIVHEGPRGAERALALCRSARLRLFTDDLASASKLFRSAIAESPAPARVRAEAREGLAWCLMLGHEDLSAAAREAGTAVASARRRGDRAAHAEALATRALADQLAGKAGALAIAQQAIALADGIEYPRTIRHPAWALAIIHTWGDRLPEALATLETLRRVAEERGDEGSLPRLLFATSSVLLLGGDWKAARRTADEAELVASQEGQQPQVGMLLFSRAVLDAHLGVDGSVSPASEAVPGNDVAGLIASVARGSRAAGLSDAEGVHRALNPLVRRCLEAGIVEPGALRFVPDEIEALIALGCLDEAGKLTTSLERNAANLARPSALAVAARCRGLIMASRGEIPGALLTLEHAMELHAMQCLPFEQQRTRLTLGTIQRRAKHRSDARVTLERAAAGFASAGAPAWATRARAEAGRIGGRVRSGDLTEAELRISVLVAEGKSNREVADALFVTVKTVEGALSRVYAKLGVHSRAAMTRLLASNRSGSHLDRKM